MKAYKGFDKDLKCKGFQYEIGKEYEEPEVILCDKGFHACLAPLDVFKYYAPATSRFCEVEIDGEIEKATDDSKIAGTKIKIIREISLAELIEAQRKYEKREKGAVKKIAIAGEYGIATAGDYGVATAGDYGAATTGYRGAATARDCGAATAGYRGAATAGDCGAATTGYRGAATVGERGVATAGYCGVATTGYRGAATAGEYGAATAGYRGTATAGDCGAATAGDCGVATTGYRGAATAGDCGAAIAGNHSTATVGERGVAVSRGSASTREQGICVARGNGCRVKGGLGSVLVLVEEFKESYKIENCKMAVVDGKKIKADTWYTLRNDEFFEVKEED